MAVVTFNSPLGSGSIEVGQMVARMLGMDYVDREVLHEVAKRIGATSQAVEKKVLAPTKLTDRASSFMWRALERCAQYDIPVTAGYQQLAEEFIYDADQLDDKRFTDVVKSVVEDLANRGNVVINGWGANIILLGHPSVFHVALQACLEKRVEILMMRHGIGESEAHRLATDTEKARLAYFRKSFAVNPYRFSHYDLTLSLDRLDITDAANLVVQATQGLGEKTSSPDE